MLYKILKTVNVKGRQLEPGYEVDTGTMFFYSDADFESHLAEKKVEIVLQKEIAPAEAEPEPTEKPDKKESPKK